jgi:hypothetical protein
MSRSEPKRMGLPVIQRPGSEIVYKRISRMTEGGIVCTVSYLKAAKPAELPAGKTTIRGKMSQMLSRARTAFWTGLSRWRKKRPAR